MKGNVIAINLNQGLIGVSTDFGITVIELLGDYDIEINDIISGELESLGGEKLYNITQDEELDVYIQDCHCSFESMRILMNLE